jgi:hypothetical protein
MKVPKQQMRKIGKRVLLLLDIARETSTQQLVISIPASELPEDLVPRKPAPN